MTGGVNDVSDHFKSFGNEVKTFKWNDDAKIEFKYLADKLGGRIPYEEVQKTLAFKENKEWIDNLVKEGYNIFDIHDPLGANITEGFSAFYDMETLTVWGRLIR